MSSSAGSTPPSGSGAKPVARAALVTHGRQVLAVGIEDVLAADVPGRVEEREPDPDGHLEQGRPLP